MYKLKGLLLIILLVVVFTGCSEIKRTECESLDVQISNSLTKITLENKNQIDKEYIDKKSIDSILLSLENSCLDLVKFASNRRMNFYDGKELSFSIMFNDTYFKYKGKTFKLKNKNSLNTDK